MNDPIDLAQQQLLEIERQLSALAARKAKLSQFIDLYRELSLGGGGIDTQVPVAARSSTPPQLSVPVDLPAPAIPMKDRIVSAASTILSVGFPMKTKELLEELQQQGIEPGGQDKVGALSALLSKDGRFKASRKEGWSLKEASLGSVPADPRLFDDAAHKADPTPEGTDR